MAASVAPILAVAGVTYGAGTERRRSHRLRSCRNATAAKRLASKWTIQSSFFERLIVTPLQNLLASVGFALQEYWTQSICCFRSLLNVRVLCSLFGLVGSTPFVQSSSGVFYGFSLFAVLLAAAVSSCGSRCVGTASYTRFSSKNQNERTILDQQRDCRQAAERIGSEITAELEFWDEAVSGAKWSREGLDTFMAAARAGRIKTAIFVNLSRLARDCVLTLTTMRELVYKLDVRVVSVDEGIDTAQTNNWELLVAIFSVQNELYLRNLSQNVFRGQVGVVLSGLCVGDYCFGFSSEPVDETECKGKGHKAPPRRYVIDVVEAEWVQKIFFWFVVERRKLRWIARKLNNSGAPKDHRATTPEWYHQLLPGLLSNRKYIGWWPWGEHKNVRDIETGEVRQVERSAAESEQWIRHFPELQFIDGEVFAKAQKLLQENAEAHAGVRQSNGQLHGSHSTSTKSHPRHLLSLLIYCGHCGRVLHVGGRNGKYLFCPGYPRGTCPCQTQLRRDRAEKMILDAIGTRILCNPSWVDELTTFARNAYDVLIRELPSRERSLRDSIADVKKRIQMLALNCEKAVVPELQAKMDALRAEKVGYEDELAILVAKGGQQVVPPTREWVESRLADLRTVLSKSEEAAAIALRQLVGGKIVVSEIKRPGRKRHYLRGRLELRLQVLAHAIELPVCDGVAAAQPIEVIEIDFREPDQHVVICDDVKQLWDLCKTEKEIATALRCSRRTVKLGLDLWYERRGLVRPDGRSCRHRLNGRRLADRLQTEIMELWNKEFLVNEIADQMKCCLETVHEAVTKWHEERGLPVPDGRTRRREIRLKREAG